MSSSPHTFRLEGSDLYASALRAQVLERCRRVLNHDLNNAVQSMHSGLELLAKCIANPSLARVSPEECITLLQQQFQSLKRTLAKLVEEIAEPPGDPEPIELPKILEEALQLLRHERAVSKATVHLSVPARALARKVHVRTIVLALLIDAVDSLDKNAAFEVRAEAAGGQSSIELRFPREGARAESARLLETVERLLADEGGELEILQEGTLRIVRLSFPSAETLSTAEAASVGERSALRVLIADRNRDAADSLAMILHLEGHETKVVYGTAQLREALKEFAADVALIDAELSGNDIREIARAARESAQTLLVQVSSSDAPKDETFDAQLIRPVEWSQLQALIAKRFNG